MADGVDGLLLVVNLLVESVLLAEDVAELLSKVESLVLDIIDLIVD